jgi:hypothetical protein
VELADQAVGEGAGCSRASAPGATSGAPRRAPARQVVRAAAVAPQDAVAVVAVQQFDRDRRAGATTSGRANSACADSGTTAMASTPGQITGPPAEKL